MIKPSHVYVISKNVVLENLRNRAFIFLVLGGTFFLVLSFLLSNMAVGNTSRVLQTYGFWILGLWGLISASFFGVNIIKHELMNKTIYLLMCRPVAKAEIIIGKFLGIITLNTFLFGVLGSSFMCILFAAGTAPSFSHGIALVYIFLEWTLLSVFSLLFSVLTSPVLHLFFISGIYLMGHWSKYLYIYSENLESHLSSVILACLYHVLPNLELLNFRDEAIFGDSVGTTIMFESLLVWGLWVLSGLSLTIIVFHRKRLM